jgi:hypothetical protein
MRSLILLAILVIMSTSCVTQKACLKRFPPTVDTVTIVEKRDSIVYKDTTIFVKLPVEVRVDSVVIPCPEVPNYIPDTVKAETSLATAKAWWSFPSIKLKLENKDDSLKIRLDNAIKEKYEWKSKYEKITVTPQPIKYIPTFYKICFWILLGELIALGIFIFLKIKKWL